MDDDLDSHWRRGSRVFVVDSVIIDWNGYDKEAEVHSEDRGFDWKRSLPTNALHSEEVRAFDRLLHAISFPRLSIDQRVYDSLEQMT